jgi:hypothetical protein
MNLKIYSLIAAGAFVLSVQSGCKKDFLDKTPIDQVTARLLQMPQLPRN